ACDALRSDDSRVTDVDDVGDLQVQADAKADEEHGGGEEYRGLPDRLSGADRPAARADPDTARQEVHQGRIRERNAREDVAVVEVPERRGERQQREQVEVSEREHPPEIEEPEQERRAEREPDRRAVDLLPTERSLVAARHLPGDLRPRPGFRHATRLVVDLSLGYLAGIDVPVLVAPPDVHRPAPTPGSSAALRGIGLVRSVGDATRGGIAVKPIGD